MATATADLRRPRTGAHRFAAGVALLLAVGAAAAHVAMTHEMGPASDAITFAMAAACIACGVHLVHSSIRHGAPSAAAWGVTALMSTCMIAAHLALGGQHHSDAGHQHSAVPPVGPGFTPDPAMTASLGFGFAECVFALAMLWLVTNDRATPASVRRP